MSQERGKIEGMGIPSTTRMREAVAKLLAQTRYEPADAKKDKYGMPIVAPEPDDPDDESAPRKPGSR